MAIEDARSRGGRPEERHGRRRVGFVHRHYRFAGLLFVVGLVFGLCSPLSAASAGAAAKVPPASDVGITPTQIRIAVVADEQPSFSPGLFVKNVKLVQAWANMLNSHGGLAGRHVVVDACDSKGDPNIAANCFIQACSKDFALVGTAEALGIANISTFAKCPNAKGQAIGIPNLEAFADTLAEQCSSVVFVIGGDSTRCATANDPRQTFTVPVGDLEYLSTHFKGLHGIYITSSTNGSLAAAYEATFKIGVQHGIKNDGTGLYPSFALAAQSAMTPLISVIKAHGSTFAFDGAGGFNATALVKEAAVQGVNTVKVWDCNDCYSTAYVQQAGAAGNNTYSTLSNLPFFSEYNLNPALKALVKEIGGVQNMDGLSLLSFNVALLFQNAVQKVVASGVTLDRSSLMHVLRTKETSFNAEGILGPTNVSAGLPSPCQVIVKLINQKWHRVFPTKPGTFDCNPANVGKISLTPSQQQ